MSSRFDPKPGEPYGECPTCEISFPDQASARAHMSETFEEGEGKSHSVRITNPARPDRIRREVGWEIDSAVSDAIESLDRLVERGDATADEIAQALRHFGHEFGEAWDEYVSGDAA